ncbi:MAG: helicase SNF2, partial [Deltaproteobacteria bacterium]|nr:helicase SNF2 [Deltaproteobacteria bacterium]
LQEHFDAVIHYDLSWNPTRHEQREGRVDRFGQKRPKVRAALLYGRNNPVDGIVLEVILRKAMRIQKELGVHVPVPDSMPNVAEALFRAFLMRHQQGGSSRGLYSYPQLELFSERKWQKAVEKNKQIRTRFAQSSIDPNEAINEWKKATSLIGGEESVKRFVTRALSRFGVEVRGREDSSSFSINLAQLRSASLKERLAMEMEIPPSETLKVSFSYPPPPFHESIQRNHPMASVLAEALLSATLSHDPANPHLIDPTEKMAILGRVGAWVVEGIPKRTIVTLLRLRHRIGTESHIGFVEEATALAWSGSFEATPIEGEEALRLLDLPSVANPPPHVRNRLKELLEELRNTHQHQLEAFAKKRAQELRQDHERIRVKPTHSKIKVEPLLPPDLVGFYLLLPRQ